MKYLCFILFIICYLFQTTIAQNNYSGVSTNSLFYSAIFHVNQKNNEAAILELQKIIDIQPDNIEANRLYQILVFDKKKDELQKRYNELAKLNPNNVAYQYLSYRIANDQGDLKELLQMHDLSPDLFYVNFNIGSYYHAKYSHDLSDDGLYNKMVAAYNSCFKLFSDKTYQNKNESYNNIHNIYLMYYYHLEQEIWRGYYIPIDSIPKFYQTQMPQSTPLSKRLSYTSAGLGYFGLRQYQKAIECLITATTLCPGWDDQGRASYYLGQSYYQSGDKEKAIALFKDVVAKYSEGIYRDYSECYLKSLEGTDGSKKIKILNIPWYRQLGPTCLPTAITMGLKFYDPDIQIKEVIKNIQGAGGSSNGPACSYLLKQGYTAYTSSAGLIEYLLSLNKEINFERLEELKYKIDNDIPVVFLTISHAMLAIGYDDNKEVFIIHDSGHAIEGMYQEIPYKYFSKKWQNGGFTSLIILTDKNISKVNPYSVSLNLAAAPNDVLSILQSFSDIAEREKFESSLYEFTNDRYSTSHNFSLLKGGLSLNRFEGIDRVWAASSYRFYDKVPRLEIGFQSKLFPTPHYPMSLSFFGEKELYGGKLEFTSTLPKQKLTLAFNMESVQHDIKVWNIPWNKGKDFWIQLRYSKDTDQRWEIGGKLDWANSLIGDYDYCKLILNIYSADYTYLIGKQGFYLRQLFGFSIGNLPNQAKFYLGPANKVRTLPDRTRNGDYLSATNLEYRIKLLKRLPTHPQIPFIGKVFFDAGLTWDKEKKFNSLNIHELETVVGIGLHYMFLDLDWGVPLNSFNRKSIKFYFNLSM